MIRWLGHPQHFIAAADCFFRLATELDHYIISTVGDYRDADNNIKPVGGGKDDLFETYVFKKECGLEQKCGCPTITDWAEVEGVRTNTDVAAERMHLHMIKKYRYK